MVHRKINPWFQMSFLVFIYVPRRYAYFEVFYMCYAKGDFVNNKHLSQSSLSRILRSFLIETLSGDSTCVLMKCYSTFVELLLQCVDEVLFQHVC